MSDRIFGTDGIRGTANKWPMTADMALRVAMATALALEQNNGGLHTRRVIIGKDTRLSGYMLEQAMASGFVAMGMEVVLVGPIPTPGIAMLTRTLRADVGVMISASHNPYQDNGIKLFGPDGYKLNDGLETAIEALAARDMAPDLPDHDSIGKASRLDDATGRYIESLKAGLPRRQTLDGLRIVVDCANGAAYRAAPQLLWELEADVIAIGASPNGRNINAECGATHLGMLQKAVVAEGADIGIALDGDADRLIMVDEKGRAVDGDQLLALLALAFHGQGKLKGGGIVATVMSNLGLEHFLQGKGLKLLRTPVGDRHVVDRMRGEGINLGGEQSGHIVLSDYGTTGDGLLAALHVLAILRESGVRASECLHLFEPLPQLLRNIRFRPGSRPLDDESVKGAIEKAERALGGAGRLLVRMSGTEPLVRVMAEGQDQAMVESVVGDVCATIERVAKAS